MTGRQVIVAANRESRPVPLRVSDVSNQSAHDPFLEGEESHTPSERLALRHQDSQADQTEWLVRVVPNRYPALEQISGRSPGGTEHEEAFELGHSVGSSVTLVGQHDVVIECPDHRTRLTELSTAEVTRVFFAWQKRLQQIRDDGRFRNVRIFRNEGAAAGASLPHCHSQIVASNVTDEQSTWPLWTSRHGTQPEENGVFLEWLNSELSDRKRVLVETNETVVICPFASRFAWQARICPASMSHDRFDDLPLTQLAKTASQLLSVTHALKMIAGDVGFNLTLTIPPCDHPLAFPWMLDILPRPGRIAGFELMTDINIVTVTPETAAARYRDAITWLPACNVADITPPGFGWR